MAIDNQRATVMAWEKSGKPYGPAFTWQDKRLTCTASKLKEWGMEEYVGVHMGRMKPTFGLNHIYWKAENEPGFRDKLEAGQLCVGGMDTWMIYRLTGGKSYTISMDNATSQGLLDFRDFVSATPYLECLRIPQSVLPQPLENAADFGVTDKSIFGVEIPICGVIADQHSAVFAQRVVNKGEAKCTLGTGAFMDVNAGHVAIEASPKYSGLMGWYLNGQPTYLAECFASTAGAFQRWLKRVFELENYQEIDRLAASVENADGLYILPTTLGMQHPEVDYLLRAAFMGISDSTTRAHIMRATLEGIAYYLRYITEEMLDSLGLEMKSLRVDGGLANSDIYCEIMAQVLNKVIKRPNSVELTALGAAEIAGMQMGLWNESDFDAVHQLTEFERQEQKVCRYHQEYQRWHSALMHTKAWTHGL